MPTTTNNGWTTPSDSDPFKDGALAIRTLGNGIDTSVGTGLLTWTAYTPTLSGMSLGNGTSTFRYARLGKVVHVRGTITLGSTSTVTGPLDVGVPFASTGYLIGHSLGSFAAYNNSGVFMGYNLSVNNSASFRAVVLNATGTYAFAADLTAAVPFVWANTHDMYFSYTYEAA
jgi:hypothetical protein